MAFKFSLYKNTQMVELARYVNGLKPSADDIRCAISVNDFHLFVRPGNETGGKWVPKVMKWSSVDSSMIVSLLDSRKMAILGLSVDDFHYLIWEVEG